MFFQSKGGCWSSSVICNYNVRPITSMRANDKFHHVLAIDKRYTQVNYIFACLLIFFNYQHESD